MKLSANKLKNIALLTCVISLAALAIAFLVIFVQKPKFYQFVSDSAARFGVSPALVYAVIRTESGFDENALSEKGALGLMQVLPSTAEFIAAKLKVENFDLNDPQTNIFLGTAYLGYLSQRFTDEMAVLAAYNAGEGRVAEWLKNPDFSPDGKTLNKVPFPETAAYIRKVRRNKKIYSFRLKLSAHLGLL